MNFSKMPAAQRQAMSKLGNWRKTQARPTTLAEARDMVKTTGIALGKPLNAIQIARSAKALLEATRCH